MGRIDGETVQRIEVDADAVEHNLEFFTDELSPGTDLLAAVKANGYGLGLDVVAPIAVRKAQWHAAHDAERTRQSRMIHNSGTGCDLSPALSWKATKAGIQIVAAGESVANVRYWSARRPDQLAVIPVGSANGYSFVLATGRGLSYMADLSLSWDGYA